MTSVSFNFCVNRACFFKQSMFLCSWLAGDGFCIKFLALFLIHCMAFGKLLNCRSCEVLSACWGAFLSSEAKWDFWSRAGTRQFIWSGHVQWKESSPCLCSLYSNWVQESRVLVSLSSAKKGGWFAGSVRKPATKGYDWIKGQTDFVEIKGQEPLGHTGSHCEFRTG